MGDLNYFQAATPPEKLRGRYYTPPDLVRLILERLQPTPDDVILDPACGDGEFLVGAVRYLGARHGRLPAEQLAERIRGLEINPDAAGAARCRLRNAIVECTGRAPNGPLGVDCRSALDLSAREALDLPSARLCVIGNPPYVEAKRLPEELRARLQKQYPDASRGAPDLYLYFLHACLDWLRDDDRLAFVLPNKVLVNTNGRGLRQRLVERAQLAGIDFATQAKIFEDAAVYPVVLYAGGAGKGQACLARIERGPDGLRRLPVPSLPVDLYPRTEAVAIFPAPDEPAAAEALVDLGRQIPRGRLHDVLDIRWSVSFHRRGLRERYITPQQPHSPHARRILGGGPFSGNGEVTRYGVRWGGWWIDYDQERLRADRNPLPDPAMFQDPKIVICQNGRTLRAAYDGDGYVLKDTFLCGMPREVDHPLTRHPEALVGVLCSQTVHFFYAHVFHGGHVNGGYLHFLRSFLVDVPLGEWPEERAAEASRLVKRREDAQDPRTQLELEAKIEALVSDAFDLPAEHRDAIARWAAADANWQARERVRWRG